MSIRLMQHSVDPPYLKFGWFTSCEKFLVKN